MSWTGWNVVPGGGLTNLSLTAVVDAGGFDLAVFCVGLDGYININSYTFTSKSWSGWSKITGTGRTIVGVSATSEAGTLYLYATGLDEVVYYNTCVKTNWSGWQPVPGGGKTKVAVCGLGENVFATGLTNDLYLNSKPPSSVWNPVPGGGTTDAAPAAVTYSSGTAETLFVFVKGTGQKIYYNVGT